MSAVKFFFLLPAFLKVCWSEMRVAYSSVDQSDYTTEALNDIKCVLF